MYINIWRHKLYVTVNVQVARYSTGYALKLLNMRDEGRPEKCVEFVKIFHICQLWLHWNTYVHLHYNVSEIMLNFA